MAAHLRELDPEGRGVEGLPGGQAEGQRGGTGCLASHQTRGSPHSGAGAGERGGALLLTANRASITSGWSLVNSPEPHWAHPSHWLLSFISETPVLRNPDEITALARLSGVRSTTRSSFCCPWPLHKGWKKKKRKKKTSSREPGSLILQDAAMMQLEGANALFI